VPVIRRIVPSYLEVIMIDVKIAKKVLEVVDKGLVKGLGKPTPGQMCVEAAVCYAMGLPHSDEPSCVSRAVRALKIGLNDSNWSSTQARAKGMRRLAVAQLGSADVVDDVVFAKKVAELSIRKSVPVALRAAASIQKDEHHKNALLDAALLCEKEGTKEAAEAAGWAGWAAARAAEAARAAAEAAEAAAEAAGWAGWAARAAERDKILSDFAEGVVQILIEIDAPGCKFLYLTE
jgi:hypothetical protein